MFKSIEYCDICSEQRTDRAHYSNRDWLLWAKYSICPSCSSRSFYEIVNILLGLRDRKVKQIESVASTRHLTKEDELVLEDVANELESDLL
jgi:hypothetical protein